MACILDKATDYSNITCGYCRKINDLFNIHEKWMFLYQKISKIIDKEIFFKVVNHAVRIHFIRDTDIKSLLLFRRNVLSDRIASDSRLIELYNKIVTWFLYRSWNKSKNIRILTNYVGRYFNGNFNGKFNEISPSMLVTYNILFRFPKSLTKFHAEIHNEPENKLHNYGRNVCRGLIELLSRFSKDVGITIANKDEVVKKILNIFAEKNIYSPSLIDKNVAEVCYGQVDCINNEHAKIVLEKRLEMVAKFGRPLPIHFKDLSANLCRNNMDLVRRIGIIPPIKISISEIYANKFKLELFKEFCHDTVVTTDIGKRYSRPIGAPNPPTKLSKTTSDELLHKRLADFEDTSNRFEIANISILTKEILDIYMTIPNRIRSIAIYNSVKKTNLVDLINLLKSEKYEVSKVIANAIACNMEPKYYDVYYNIISEYDEVNSMPKEVEELHIRRRPRTKSARKVEKTPFQ